MDVLSIANSSINSSDMRSCTHVSTKQKVSIVLCWAMLMLFYFPSFGQGLWEVFNTTNSSLPFNTIHAIEIAPDGKKWIGTEFGLAVLDDTTWTIYNVLNSDIPDNSVRAIAFDSTDNAVWIGTFLGGVARFDGVSWTVYTTTNSELPDNFIRALAVSPLGNLWVGTTGGLVKIVDTTWFVYDAVETELGSNNISTLSMLGEDTLWVGTINGGATFIESDTWTTHDILTTGIPDNTQTGIAHGVDDVVWMSSPAHGLMLFSSGTWLSFDTFTSDIFSNSLSDVVAQGSNVWMATLDTGLTLFQSPSTWINFDTSNSDIPSDRLNCMTWDHETDKLWIGTETEGVAVFDAAEFLMNVPEELKIQWALYPNPTSGVLHIKSDRPHKRGEVALYNSEGSQIQIQHTRFSAGAGSHSLDLSSLPAGIYFLQLTVDGVSWSKRILKTD